MANEDLHKPLKAINQSVAKVRTEIVSLIGEVEKIHTAVLEAADTIRDAIQENIQAQAELKLMEHVMDVRSVKPQIEAEREQITTERNELEERLQSIGERYQGRHEELDETAGERIRDLGSHIFEIDEDHFEAGIEDPFTSQVTSSWQVLQAHNEAVREEREDRVRDTTGDVVQTIHDFVDRQEALVETIENHRLDATELSVPADRAERLQVPYYVVEYEVDGVAHRETVVPSTLSTAEDNDWCSLSLSPIAGANDVFGDVSGASSPERTESMSTADLEAPLEEHADSSPLGLSYLDALRSATPAGGSIPVRKTGGDD